jgi:hypothetical protein
MGACVRPPVGMGSGDDLTAVVENPVATMCVDATVRDGRISICGPYSNHVITGNR